MDQIFIQHRFTIEKDGQSYSDALIYSKDEYDKLDKEEIEKEKQARFDNWVEMVKNPPIVPEASEEEKLAYVESELARLQSDKINLTQAIADKIAK